MGLDAVVYRNKANIELGEKLDKAKIDERTGEIYFENEIDDRETPRDLIEAAEYRIGNIAEVDSLRDEIATLLGPGNQIGDKVLYSGSHSGDVIPVDQLPRLAGEIESIQKMNRSSKELSRFLENLKALINAAINENNPIVFV